MNNIVIIAASALCAEALAEEISFATGMKTIVIKAEDLPLAAEMDKAALVIFADLPPVTTTAKTLYFKFDQPLKIRNILKTVNQALNTQNSLIQPLGKEIILNKISRKLENTASKTSIYLTEKEQDLLLFIYNCSEAKRDEILNKVWSIASDIDTHTLETHIYRLRQKWRELTDYDCIIATEKGYSWNESGNQKNS